MHGRMSNFTSFSDELFDLPKQPEDNTEITLTFTLVLSLCETWLVGFSISSHASATPP